MDTDARVRVSPLQPRGKQSVGKMLDSTGTLLDEVGYERLTTQLVAKRAGVSIGLVYHYFPDRLALVQALIARNFERCTITVGSLLDRPEVTDWRAALDVVLDVLTAMYRHEAGFAKVGLGGWFLAAQNAPGEIHHGDLARTLLALQRERFSGGRPVGDELLVHFETAVEIGDALIHRAFRCDRAGDATFLDAARAALIAYLTPNLGDV